MTTPSEPGTQVPLLTQSPSPSGSSEDGNDRTPAAVDGDTSGPPTENGDTTNAATTDDGTSGAPTPENPTANEKVNGDENYEQVPHPKWNDHLEKHPGDIKYLTEPAIPLIDQFRCEIMIPEHCDFALRDSEGEYLTEKIKTAAELKQDAAVYGPSLFKDCVDGVFMYLCVFVLKSVISNLHPAQVFLTMFSDKQLEGRAESFLPNFLAFMTLTFSVGAFNTAFHVPTVAMVLSKAEGKKRKRKDLYDAITMKERATYFLGFLAKHFKTFHYGKDKTWQFARSVVIAKNVNSWKQENAKKPMFGLYTNGGLMAKCKAAEANGNAVPPGVSGIYMGWAYPMDRITELFESFANEEGGLISLCGGQERGDWYELRHERRLYTATKKTKTPPEETRKETSVLQKNRVVLSNLEFSDGFLTGEMKAFLKLYAAKKEDFLSNPGKLRTLLDKLAMDNAFDSIMATEYFALACVCCHEHKKLKAVVNFGDDFIGMLQDVTKRLMNILQKKQPAASA